MIKYLLTIQQALIKLTLSLSTIRNNNLLRSALVLIDSHYYNSQNKDENLKTP